MFPVSTPPGYARDLASAVGTFHTAGMAEDHRGLSNERYDEEAFLEHCTDVLHERERMMAYELERFERGLFFCLFDTPDRIQHMFWRFGSATHPANRSRDDTHLDADRMRHVIPDHYRRCDQIVGRAMEHVDDSTLLVVLSDHGMTSFERGVHLNSWLRAAGLLAVKQGHDPDGADGSFFHGVDWGRTKAYSLGLGGIYLNLKGRERDGTVGADEAEHVKSTIAEGLSGLVDPERGDVAVRRVLMRDQVYRGACLAAAPDVVVGFNHGYRASWATTLGGVPDGLFEDNTKKWSGDHIVDPDLVPGVLFMNRPFDTTRAALVDLAPTILGTMGVPAAAQMEGRSLL
jgi:predicted AlkP superfamily phosphohydrolase/phosphomutase